jgi:hypothetical protein
MEVRGLGDVQAATGAVDSYLSSVSRAPSTLEALRIKQREAAETASRLGTAIRQLQRVEGDNSVQLRELRLEYERATQRAREYGEQAAKLDTTSRSSAEGTSGLGGAMRGVGIAMAGAAIVAAAAHRAISAVVDQIGAVVDRAGEIDDASQRLGISARALQEWEFVAQQSGVANESLHRSIQTLARNAAGPGAAGIRRLGVAVRDSSHHLRSQEAIFSDTVTALARVENQTERAAAAQRVFGRSGAEILTLINQGPEGIDRLRERFAELGGGLSNDVVQAGAEAGDALDAFDTATDSLRSSLVVSVLPALTRIVEVVSTIVGSLTEFIRTSSAAETVLGILAVAAAAVAIAMMPILLTATPIIVALGLLFLVVEDVVTAFRGGDSVFGRTVEHLLEMMGISMTFTGVIDQLGVAWDRLAAHALSGAADVAEAIEGVQLLTGIGDQDAAAARTAGMRGRAAEASRTADQSAYQANLREQIAMTERRSSAGGGAPSTVTISKPTSIVIHGATDPQAVSREVDRRLSERDRDAADELALAPEAA